MALCTHIYIHFIFHLYKYLNSVYWAWLIIINENKNYPPYTTQTIQNLLTYFQKSGHIYSNILRKYNAVCHKNIYGFSLANLLPLPHYLRKAITTLYNTHIYTHTIPMLLLYSFLYIIFSFCDIGIQGTFIVLYIFIPFSSINT